MTIINHQIGVFVRGVFLGLLKRRLITASVIRPCSSITITLILLTISTVQTQTNPTLAVLDFEGYGISVFEVQTLTDRLRNNIAGLGNYRLVERGAMEEILKEQGFQQTGCTSDECIVEVGKLLGVQYMLGGSMGKVGKTLTVSMRIIDVETGAIINTANYDMTGEIDELLTHGMREAASLLLGKKEEEPSPPARLATLNIVSSPSGTIVTILGEEKGKTPLRLKDLLPNREYPIRLMKPDYHSLDTTIFLQPGDKSMLRLTLLRKKGWLTVTGSPQSSELFIHANKIGILPLSRFSYPTGEYTLVAKKPEYFPEHRDFKLAVDQEVTLNITLKRKPKGKAILFSTIIPGTGQLYQGYSFRGIIFLAAGLATGYLAQQSYSQFIDSRATYEDNLDLYNNEKDPNMFTSRELAVTESFQKMKDYEDSLLKMAGALGAVWTINIVEVVF